MFPAFRPRAGRQSTRDEVALQLHPGGQGHHVAAFLVRDRDRVLGEGSGELILRLDTPLENDVKDMIAAQLDAALERLTVIGHGRDGESRTSQASGAAPASS